MGGSEKLVIACSNLRQTYDGPLEVGEDLMSFEIGDEVIVRRFLP
jgi:hypothetical protein